MDVEETIEFLLRWVESDARLASHVKVIDSQIQVMAAQIVKLGNSQIAIQETQFKQLEMINGLIDASVRHEARSKEIDERLNALISVVDDLVRRRN